MQRLFCLLVCLLPGLPAFAQETAIEFEPDTDFVADTTALFSGRTFGAGVWLDTNPEGLGTVSLSIGSYFGTRDSESHARYVYFGVYSALHIWGTQPVPVALQSLNPSPVLELWHTGIQMEITLASNTRFRGYGLLRTGWGTAAWKQNGGYLWGRGKTIGVYEPGAGCEFSLSPRLKLDAQLAYRWLSDLALTGTRPTDLNSWMLRLGLRLTVPQ